MFYVQIIKRYIKSYQLVFVQDGIFYLNEYAKTVFKDEYHRFCNALLCKECRHFVELVCYKKNADQGLVCTYTTALSLL